MALGPRGLLRLVQVARRFSGYIGSTEYSEISGAFPLHLPPLDIELDATPEQLALMLQRIEECWTELGQERPHNSVMTETRFRPKNLAENVGSFWESGQGEVETALFVLRRFGFGDPATKTCVEYGSGLGRVTIPLAQRFAELHAYDISATHMAAARARAETCNLANIRFHHRGGGLLDPLEPCDFFYSRLVLQHNPPPVIRELIRLALAALHPDGIAIFGVPVYLAGYSFRIAEYLRSRRKPPIEMHCIPQHEVFALAAAAGCSVLEVREERSITPGMEVLSNFFVIGRA